MPGRKVKPPTAGLTEEAREALAMQGIAGEPETDLTDATDSDAANYAAFIDDTPSDGTHPEIFFGDTPEIPQINPGDAIDSEISREPAVLPPPQDEESVTKGFGRRRRKNPSDPKATPPNVDEWMDFFSRIVIRFLTEWYVDMMFRGIDEDNISDKDAAKLLLTDDERDVIARPFAEYANKNPFMRKHGRQIVAFADSFESIVILGKWYSRVNRIARKYRPKPQKGQTVHATVTDMNGHSHNGNSGPGTQGAANGNVPTGFSVFNPGGS